MKIKDTIEEIFEHNTDYARPGQAINQSQSLNALSKDLYTDAKRFIYELLQNADDSALPEDKLKVSIRLFGDQLLVSHTGKPFDKRDLRGLCGVNDGTKKNSPEKTGFKGIGFKAVFGQSDKVIVYSQGEYFTFDSEFKHEWKQQWGGTQASWEQENDRLFEFPWQIIPIYTNPDKIASNISRFLKSNKWTVGTLVTLRNITETVAAIKELSDKVNMFLFLKNIKEIDFNIEESKVISIEHLENQEVVLKLNDIPKARWLINTVMLPIPGKVKSTLQTDQNIPPKLKDAVQIELILAAKIGENGIEALPSNERLLYAYLPTEEQKYSIPVLVNTAFLTVANRESLHADSLWNQWLFGNISKELFKWIAQLVTGNFKYQAYKILPDKLSQRDALTSEYNTGFDYSVNNTPFVVTESGSLLKVNETIIDFTYLSDKLFVGKSIIRKFIVESTGSSQIHANPYVPNTGSGNKLKMLGVITFEWTKLPELLNYKNFLKQHTVEKNIELISYFKTLSAAEKPSEVNDTVLKNWPFILDHKGQLRPPKDIFSPAPDDKHWNSPDGELSFLHPELQDWLGKNTDTKIWLTNLGIAEKSDLTYLEKTILPNADTFITIKNAIATIQNIFYLHQKGEINNDKVRELSSLKLLTTCATLLPASEVYLSKEYLPRAPLQNIITTDFYLSTGYLSSGADKSEWKRFFKLLGVKEGVTLLTYTGRKTVTKLIKKGFLANYFDLDDKKFKPAFSWFTATEYSNINSLFLLNNCMNNVELAKLFWEDAIKNVNLQELSSPAIAYWGKTAYPGWNEGDNVNNYVQWFIRNNACIPGTNDTCQVSSEIFLNEDQIQNIGGKYLPIFDGVELDADWRSFFQFKTQLELNDYLSILTKISEDPKGDNKKRIQSIYEYLLNNCANWSSSDQDLVKNWALTGSLMDQNNTFRNCKELGHYMDGDNSIFQNAFQFINLNKANQQHSSLEGLLALFQITIFKQSVFVLDASNPSACNSLSDKLVEIIPYWAKWMNRHNQDEFEKREYELEQKLTGIKFFQANELIIMYGKEWSKKVNLYFSNWELYLLNPWDSTKVMLTLPETLCDYFGARGYQSELAFLLKSTREEIDEYFEMEGIDLPPIQKNIEPSGKDLTTTDKVLSEPKPGINYQALWEENLKRNAALIEKAENNSSSLLLNGLGENIRGQDINIYHFTHLENAVSIIKEGAIKSRSTALFKDSAGSGIIGQTGEDRKQFARFYFRTQTPTQYYVENWGRGQDSLDKLNSDPVCPVPVFFIIPIKLAMKETNWSVSLGSLASPQVEFGNSFDIVSKFDFKDLYKSKSEISHDRYMVSSHQEFLVKEQLNLENVDYRLAVQDKSAKETLLAMLNDNEKWESIIDINPSLYHGGNPKIEISSSANEIKVVFGDERPGHFVLQHREGSTWLNLNSDYTNQFYSGNITTTITNSVIEIAGDLSNVKFNLFYCYKGHLWLVYTNHNINNFEGHYMKVALEMWLEGASTQEELIKILKTHPELNYWYGQSVGAPDELTLEQHTLSVINNYVLYFKGKQLLLENEKFFLLFLALHDIGKPLAITLGDKTLQHEQSLIIINKIKELLPVKEEVIERIKILLSRDIIGKYLDPKYSATMEATLESLRKMANDLSMTVMELWPSLLMYYQSDAAGYNSLRKRLFKNSVGDGLELLKDESRLIFNDELELKFLELENNLKE